MKMLERLLRKRRGWTFPMLWHGRRLLNCERSARNSLYLENDCISSKVNIYIHVRRMFLRGCFSKIPFK